MRILALAGDGYLYTATVLAELEARGGEPLGRRFDLIAGTSVGGIAARASDGSRREPACHSWHRDVLAARTATRQGEPAGRDSRWRELPARDFAAAQSVRRCTASPSRDPAIVDPEKRPSQASALSARSIRCCTLAAGISTAWLSVSPRAAHRSKNPSIFSLTPQIACIRRAA